MYRGEKCIEKSNRIAQIKQFYLYVAMIFYFFLKRGYFQINNFIFSLNLCYGLEKFIKTFIYNNHLEGDSKL